MAIEESNPPAGLVPSRKGEITVGEFFAKAMPPFCPHECDETGEQDKCNNTSAFVTNTRVPVRFSHETSRRGEEHSWGGCPYIYRETPFEADQSNNAFDAMRRPVFLKLSCA